MGSQRLLVPQIQKALQLLLSAKGFAPPQDGVIFLETKTVQDYIHSFIHDIISPNDDV